MVRMATALEFTPAPFSATQRTSVWFRSVVASRVRLLSTISSISVVVVLKMVSGLEMFHVILGAGTPLAVHVKTTTS